MTCRSTCVAIALGLLIALPPPGAAQNQQAQEPVTTTVTADYPLYRPGVLIRGSGWVLIPAQFPAKTHAKHGLAPALTYGIAPARIVSDYSGQHAQVKIGAGRPVICVCHIMSLPGPPALVRLQEKKNFRQLNGGNLHFGTKVAEAKKNDLIPVNVSQPESTVWLVQPQEALPPGEYALMLGSQNMNIYPFSVVGSTIPAETRKRH